MKTSQLENEQEENDYNFDSQKLDIAICFRTIEVFVMQKQQSILKFVFRMFEEIKKK